MPPGEVHIYYDPLSVPEGSQQPQAQQVAVFEAKRNDENPNGSALDVNQHFVVYAVKNGLIRVLHRASTLKNLLRAHEGKQVTDIKFFQNGDILGTVGGNVVVWRVFERSQEIVAEKLLEIPDTFPSVSRLIWHPFNPNQFWLIHRNRDNVNVATLVETTRISTVVHATESHAVCRLFSSDVVMEGALQLATDSNLTDLVWSGRDARHVLTTHEDGSIKLWDLKADSAQNANGVVPAVCKATIQEDGPVTRCLFLPHDNIATNYGIPPDSTITTVFCTASKGNSCITIWSPFTETEAPTKLQSFQMDGADPKYNIDICYGPTFFQSVGDTPAFFLMLSDRCNGKMYALAIKSIWGSHEPKRPLVEGFEYVVPFLTKFPTYSWSVAVFPAKDMEENAPFGGLNFDIRFYALQSKMVQDMTIPHYMLLPPTSLWEADTLGVRVERLALPSRGGIVEDHVYEEDYELDDVEEDDDDDEDYAAPDPSSLPQPDGLGDPMGGNNPFANWLGNLATKPSVEVPPEPQRSAIVPLPSPVPVAPVAPRAPPPGLFAPVPPIVESVSREGSGLLSPMEILSSSSQDARDTTSGNGHKQQQAVKKNKSPRVQRGASPKAKGRDKKTANFPPGPVPVPSADGKIAILKRGQEIPVALPVETSAAVPAGLEESLKKAIASQFKAQEKIIVAEIQRVVRQEIKQTILPELSKTVTTTVEQAVVRPLQSSMEKFVNKAPDVKTTRIIEAVTSGVEEPLKEVFTDVSVATYPCVFVRILWLTGFFFRI